jgi:hypothetical protein
MSIENFVQYIGLFIFLLIIVYIFRKVFVSQVEGMQTRQKEGTSNDDATIKVNHGINAENFTDRVKSMKNTMRDKLNIPTYRTDYENLLIELNDHVSGMMLDELLSIDPTNIQPTHIINKLNNINKLSNGKNNLNDIMKYIDKN